MQPALLVIDVQEDFFADEYCPIYQESQLFGHINRLIEIFRRKSLPIIFIHHTEGEELAQDSPGWQVYHKLDADPDDLHLSKTTPDSFYNTELQAVLDQMDVNELVICGLQTDYCIDTTCRSAFGKGIKATLAGEAHSTYDNNFMSAEEIINYHNNLIGKWFAEVTKTRSIIEDLESAG